MIQKFFSMVVLVGFFLSPVFQVSAVSDPQISELQGSIANLNDEIEKIQKEIDTYKNQVSKIGQEKQTLQTTLSKIDGEQKKLGGDVRLTDTKIKKTDITLTELKEGITVASSHIDLHKESIAQNMRRVYELDTMPFIEIAFGQERISDIFQEMNTISQLYGAMKNRVTELRYMRVDLDSKRNVFQTEKEQLEDLKQEILDKKKIIEQQKKEKAALLKETQSEESKYQTLIAEREVLRKAFESELYEYESKLKVVLNPASLPAKGSAALSWPVTAPPVVTQLFRAQTGPHVNNPHSGVDFRADGDPVYAMADGVVSGTGNTDLVCPAVSFGKWVFIRFDNRLAATYGHLSIISVKEGQKVTRGQLIGYSGATGRVTGPHLHVSLYADIDAEGNTVAKVEGKESNSCKGKILVQPRAATAAYLNLLDYTPKTTPAMFKAGIK